MAGTYKGRAAIFSQSYITADGTTHIDAVGYAEGDTPLGFSGAVKIAQAGMIGATNAQGEVRALETAAQIQLPCGNSSKNLFESFMNRFLL